MEVDVATCTDVHPQGAVTNSSFESEWWSRYYVGEGEHSLSIMQNAEVQLNAHVLLG